MRSTGGPRRSLKKYIKHRPAPVRHRERLQLFSFLRALFPTSLFLALLAVLFDRLCGGDPAGLLLTGLLGFSTKSANSYFSYLSPDLCFSIRFWFALVGRDG